MSTLTVSPTVMRDGYLNHFPNGMGSDIRNSYIRKYSRFELYQREVRKSDAYNIYAREDNTVDFFKRVRETLFLGKLENTYSLVIYSSTSAYEVGCINRKETAVNEATYSLSDMIEKIKEVFGLPTSSIASIVGVSRATIYNHLSSTSAEVSEYSELFNLALKIEKSGLHISKGIKSVVIDGKTLLKHLNTKPLNSDKILEVSRVVSIKLQSMQSSERPSVDEEKLVAILNNR